MAVVRKGTGWQVRVRDVDGEFFPYRSFARKADAVAYEAELIQSRSRGGRAQAKEWREMTLAEYWARWSTEFRTRVSKGWRISQDQVWRDHINPILGKTLIVEVSRSDIAAVLLKAEEKGLGPQTRIHIWNLLHKMFDDAVEELDALDASPVRKSLRPEAPKVSRAFLEPHTARQFLAHAANDYIGPAVWLMTLAGLRIGEAQGLRWEDVDLENRQMLICRQWNRKVMAFGPPKNGKPIRVPILPELAEYLFAVRPKDWKPEDLVMKGKRRGGVVHYDTIHAGLVRLAKAAEIKRVTPHELRHTCTEMWISERGATIEDIRRLLNHSSEASTKPYIHRTDDRLKRIAESKPVLKLVQKS